MLVGRNGRMAAFRWVLEVRCFVVVIATSLACNRNYGFITFRSAGATVAGIARRKGV